MPKIQFVAPDIRAAIASLKAGLPAQVALYNAEPANTLDLVAPADEAIYFGGNDALAAVGFPAIEVAAMEGRFGNFTVNRLEADHDPTINVVVWQEGTTGDIPTMYELALGYARVVIEVLMRDDAFGPGAEIAQQAGIYWRCDVIPVEPTSETREFRIWRLPMFLRFTIEKVERYA